MLQAYLNLTKEPPCSRYEQIMLVNALIIEEYCCTKKPVNKSVDRLLQCLENRIFKCPLRTRLLDPFHQLKYYEILSSLYNKNNHFQGGIELNAYNIYNLVFDSENLSRLTYTP